MTKATLLQFAMIPMELVPVAMGPTTCTGLPLQALAYGAGVPLAFLKDQREDALEAHFLGLQYVYKRGYDPRTYIALLRRATPNHAVSKSAGVFCATPPLAQRIAQAEKEINRILPNAPEPHSNPEFAEMKVNLQRALVATPSSGDDPHLRRPRL